MAPLEPAHRTPTPRPLGLVEDLVEERLETRARSTTAFGPRRRRRRCRAARRSGRCRPTSAASARASAARAASTDGAAVDDEARQPRRDAVVHQRVVDVGLDDGRVARDPFRLQAVADREVRRQRPSTASRSFWTARSCRYRARATTAPARRGARNQARSAPRRGLRRRSVRRPGRPGCGRAAPAGRGAARAPRRRPAPGRAAGRRPSGSRRARRRCGRGRAGRSRGRASRRRSAARASARSGRCARPGRARSAPCRARRLGRGPVLQLQRQAVRGGERLGSHAPQCRHGARTLCAPQAGRRASACVSLAPLATAAAKAHA